jgi:hypothetical protein
MGSSSSEIDIRAGVREVWEVLEDVRLLPELSKGTVAVDAPDRLTEVGDRFEQTVELGGRSFSSTWEVKEIVPRRRLVIEGSVLPGTKYRMTEVLEEVGDDPSDPCTRLTLTMDYSLPFGPLGRLAARLGVERRARSEAVEVLHGIERVVTERRRRSPGTTSSGDGSGTDDG